MSYKLFKYEVLSSLYPKHTDRFRQAITLARAYNNLVLQHYEPLTGGGKFIAGTIKVPLIAANFQAIFEAQRKTGFNKINIFKLLKPSIDFYWSGMVCIGSLGIVTVTSPGVFKGPAIPNNTDTEGFMDIFSAVIRAHLLTISGTYVNYYTGATTPWSGATLLSLP